MNIELKCYSKFSKFYFHICGKTVLIPRGAEWFKRGTPSKPIIYILRNHHTKFGALDHHVTIKTVTDQTKMAANANPQT